VATLQRSAYVRWIHDPTATIPAAPTADGTGPNPSHPSDLETVPAAAALAGGAGGAASFDTADLPTLLSELDGIDDAALLVGAPDAWFLLDETTDEGRAAFATWHTAFYGQLRTYADVRPKQDLFLIVDLLRQGAAASATAASSATASYAQGFTRSSFAGLYWPHVRVADPVGTGLNPTVAVPPSGAVAGLFARIDGRRGVWKAPAGVEATVGGITGVQHDVLDSHQDDLNPLGVNVIRPVPGAGIVVWGARTSMPSSEWRYVPVRRTAMFLRKSIYNGIQWAVFEPNDEPLWQSLRTSVSAFMETQFRNGAFAGATSKDAYFVKCDAQTTTEIDRASGVVNILVGFAPLRPAEFVVVKLSQITKTAA
jgi:uncharacterized protein